MAELATITVYDDAGPSSYALEPISDSEWLEVSTTKSHVAKVRSGISKLLLKNKLTRRMFKTDVPVMEQIGSAGTQEGYVAAPRVAHNISVSTAVFCDDSRATQTEIANAMKLHFNAILADATAGTANVWRDATTMPRKFLTTGVGGD